jgi:outer membrane lipoprotein SlyB
MRAALGLTLTGLLSGALAVFLVEVEPGKNAVGSGSGAPAFGAEYYVGGEMTGLHIRAESGQTKRHYIVLLDTGDMIQVPTGKRSSDFEIGDRICLRAEARRRAVPVAIVALDRCAR